MGWLSKRYKVALLAGTLLFITLVVLLQFKGPERACPQNGDGTPKNWSSPHVPLFSKQCPGFYDCPLPPGTGRQLMPDGASVEIVVNNECYRGELPEQSEEALTVVFLGDSFAFGFRAEEGKPFPAVTGEMLSERLGCPVDIANLAVPGYSLHDKLLSLKKKGLSYIPDVVVLQLFLDDWFDNEEAQSYLPPITWLANAIKSLGCRRCEGWNLELCHLNHQLFQRVHSGYSKGEQGKMGELWREFEELSLQENFTLVVLDLNSPAILEAIPQDLAPRLEQHLIHSTPEWWMPENVIPDDGHFNEAGHRLIAEAVVGEIINSSTISCGADILVRNSSSLLD